MLRNSCRLAILSLVGLLALFLHRPAMAKIEPCGLVNPSFEAFDGEGHPIGWTGGHATDHTGWLEHVPDGKAYGYAVEAPMYQDVEVTAGSAYTLAFWSGSHVPGFQTVSLLYLDADGNQIGESHVHTITTDVDVEPKIFGGPYLLALPPAPNDAVAARVVVDPHGVDWAKVDGLCLNELLAPTAEAETVEPTSHQRVDILSTSAVSSTYHVVAWYEGAASISIVALLDGIDGRYTYTVGGDTINITFSIPHPVESVLFHADGQLRAVVSASQFARIGEPASDVVVVMYLPILTKQ